MDRITEKSLVYIFLILSLVSFSIVVFLTHNSFGGGDHFEHYKLAHWGWKYPDMLFNHWGKPVFTILISPFAQFGINGARLYNVVMGIITAYLCWRIARQFELKQSWAVVPLVLFTPIYFILMFTSLTEVTFSFFITLSIFFFFREKYILSAVVLSFLPMVRTEGIVLIPIFVGAYIFKRQFTAIPFLAVGFLVISILGWPFYSSFWWIVTEMPYSGSARDIYGSGSLFHFIDMNHEILGDVGEWLFILGVVSLLFFWGSKDRFRPGKWFYFLLLVTGSFVVFFAAHSYVWWKGMGNSLGLIRVIGSVTPLAALTAMAGIDILFGYKNKWANIVATILLVGVLGINSYHSARVHRYGFRLYGPQRVLTEVVDYVQKNRLDNYKIYYFNPFVQFSLGLDPRDQQRSNWMLPNRDQPSLYLPDSSVIIWDAHFGPNEGGVQLELLEAQQDLVHVKTFRPETPFTVLGGYDYRVDIFQKDLSRQAE